MKFSQTCLIGIKDENINSSVYMCNSQSQISGDLSKRFSLAE